LRRLLFAGPGQRALRSEPEHRGTPPGSGESGRSESHLQPTIRLARWSGAARGANNLFLRNEPANSVCDGMAGQYPTGVGKVYRRRAELYGIGNAAAGVFDVPEQGCAGAARLRLGGIPAPIPGAWRYAV